MLGSIGQASNALRPLQSSSLNSGNDGSQIPVSGSIRPTPSVTRPLPRHISPGQVALAWLLACSPVMLPVPGTSSSEPLEENVAASALELDKEEIE